MNTPFLLFDYFVLDKDGKVITLSQAILKEVIEKDPEGAAKRIRLDDEDLEE